MIALPIRRDESLRALVTEQLRGFERRPLPVDRRHHAAVALAIVDECEGAGIPGLPRSSAEAGDRAALLLTRRATGLRHHAGQWALPGGRVEADESPEEAALRELAEEIGLIVGRDTVLGCLDDFATRSGFVMTPVVVWPGRGDALVLNPDEVRSVHRIPLDEFMREDAPVLDVQTGSEHPVLRMPVGASWIAAPTAALLYQFRELCLCGRPTRVAHYEQPRFAWR
jgi:8-oxo-dGTP pyrophosphatase MutT (NUDIX family)